MRTLIHYAWEPTDPPITFIKDAVVLLHEFIKGGTYFAVMTGPDAPSMKAFTRLGATDGFSEADVRTTAEFLKELAGRARAEYSDPAMNDAPWKATAFQSADNAIAAGDQLLKLFYSLAPNIKPIAEAPQTAPGGQAESAPAPVPITPEMPTPQLQENKTP